MECKVEEKEASKQQVPKETQEISENTQSTVEDLLSKLDI